MRDPVLERNEVFGRLKRAVTLLEGSMDPRLIPPGGMSIGYAIRGARDADGIAAVEGSIIYDGRRVHAAGPSGFGVDAHIARFILTTMKFNPVIRTAASLKYSAKAIMILEDLFLECVSYCATPEPAGISTMDWGVASCCKDDIPDVLFSCSGEGDEGIIYLTGEDPVVVANNILILSGRILHSEL